MGWALDRCSRIPGGRRPWRRCAAADSRHTRWCAAGPFFCVMHTSHCFAPGACSLAWLSGPHAGPQSWQRCCPLMVVTDGMHAPPRAAHAPPRAMHARAQGSLTHGGVCAWPHCQRRARLVTMHHCMQACPYSPRMVPRVSASCPKTLAYNLLTPATAARRRAFCALLILLCVGLARCECGATGLQESPVTPLALHMRCAPRACYLPLLSHFAAPCASVCFSSSCGCGRWWARGLEQPRLVCA